MQNQATATRHAQEATSSPLKTGPIASPLAARLQGAPPAQRLTALQRRLQSGNPATKGGPPVQRLKKDADKFIRAHHLENIKADYWDIINYARDGKPMAEGLVAAWNENQPGKYRITEEDLAPQSGELTPEQISTLMMLIMAAQAGSSDEGEDVDQLEDMTAFHHFTKGTKLNVAFSGAGELMGDGTGKKASGSERKRLMKLAGIGEHIFAGHVGMSAATLKSQAQEEQSNFTWASDRALMSAVERGRMAFALRKSGTGEEEEKSAFRSDQKSVVVDIGPHDGFGVIEYQGKFYKVYPKKARVVVMAKGDLKTAYGITEFKDPANTMAYYGYEEI